MFLLLITVADICSFLLIKRIKVNNMNNDNKRDEVDNTDKKLHISDVIGSVDSKIDLIGKKGKELWYPTYAPHIDIKTGKSILDEIYMKHPNLRHYR